MKKILSALLLLIIVISLAACTPSTPPTPDNPEPDNPVAEPDPEPDPEPEPEPEPEPVVKENVYILAATWTHNMRHGSNRVATDAGNVALIKLGQEIKLENAHNYKYVGEADIDALVGSPVEVTFEKEGGPVTEIASTGTSVTYIEDMLAVSDGQVLANGEKLKITDKLISDYKKYSFAPSGIIFLNTRSLEEVDKTDEIVTFYDTDEDGKYDFYKRTEITNGVLITSVSNTKIKVDGQYGSEGSTGWFDGRTAVNYTLADGVRPLKEGDRVNLILTVDCTSSTYIHKSFPCRIEIVSVCDKVSGTLENVEFGEYADPAEHVGEDVFADMKITVDGKEYSWSGAYSRTNGYADGAFGHESGRIAMQYANYGKGFDFYFDTRGHVIFADKHDKSVSHVGEEQMTLGDTILSTQWDIQGTFLSDGTTYDTLTYTVKALYELGYRRFSVVYTNPGYPSYPATINGASPTRSAKQNEEEFAALGFKRPIDAVADIAHKYGMECYVVYKPYEGGGTSTYPVNATVNKGDYPIGAVESVGGYRGVYDTFLDDGFAAGKDYRVCRRPDNKNATKDLPITKITIDYLLEPHYYFATHASDAMTPYKLSSPKNFPKIGEYASDNPHPTHPVVLWTSKDNYTYEVFDDHYKYDYFSTSKVLKDANGQYVLKNEKAEEKTTASRILQLTIYDINITADDAQYLAFSFENSEGLNCLVYSAITLYSGDTVVASTAGDYVRSPRAGYTTDNPRDYLWGAENVPGITNSIESVKVGADGKPTFTMLKNGSQEYYDISVHFHEYGFEFGYYPYIQTPKRYALMAVARGVDEFTPGSPCEAYAETREYWLNTIKDIVAAGFDGIEVRLQSHSTMTVDYYNYGYNEPIVEKYKEIYGQAAYNTLMDPAHTVTHQEFKRIMEIRGDFFLDWAQSASNYCKMMNVPFSVNVRESYENLSDIGEYTDSDRLYLSGSMNAPTQWTMPKILIDWKRAVDLSSFVTFKDYILATNNPKYCDLIDHAEEIKAYAKAQGKEVWIQCYDEQSGNQNNFSPEWLTYAERLGDVDCISIYEIRSMYFWAKKNHEVYEKAGTKIVDVK